MELFLMVLLVSVLCLGLTALTFSHATKEPDRQAAEAPSVQVPISIPAPSRFFGEQPAPSLAALNRRMSDPAIEAMLLQLERHIRLEQAAAQAFLEEPTAQSLHSRTTSPFMN